MFHIKAISSSEDKWNEFATSNNGRKFEVWIGKPVFKTLSHLLDQISQGVFDFYGWTGGNRWGVSEEFTFTLAAGAPHVDLEMTRFTYDRQNPNGTHPVNPF